MYCDKRTPVAHYDAATDTFVQRRDSPSSIHWTVNLFARVCIAHMFVFLFALYLCIFTISSGLGVAFARAIVLLRTKLLCVGLPSLTVAAAVAAVDIHNFRHTVAGISVFGIVWTIGDICAAAVRPSVQICHSFDFRLWYFHSHPS